LRRSSLKGKVPNSKRRVSNVVSTMMRNNKMTMKKMMIMRLFQSTIKM
jgi:hypothetical protein